MLQAVGDGRALRPGEPGGPEATAGHEVGLAPELPLPPPTTLSAIAPPAPAARAFPTLALGADLN